MKVGYLQLRLRRLTGRIIIGQHQPPHIRPQSEPSSSRDGHPRRFGQSIVRRIAHDDERPSVSCRLQMRAPAISDEPAAGTVAQTGERPLRFQAVTVQHKARVRHDTELGPNDVVTIAVRKRVRDDALECQGLKIIHLDDAVVVVDKPTGSFRWARNVRRRGLRIGSSMNI